MVNYLFQMHNAKLFFMLSFGFVIASFIAILLVRRFIPLSLRNEHNVVIGNTVALISVIYGVLAGFSALYLLNNNTYAADAVQREANAIADIYRASQWLPNPLKQDIHSQVEQYANQVINKEWPLMRQGKKVSTDGERIVGKMVNELLHYQIKNKTESIIIPDILSEIKLLYDARLQRIHMSYAQLSTQLWIVILIGTLLTLCINYLFGMNFYLHGVTVTAAALMASSMIFLLISLDRPFQGEFSIQPEAFQSLLNAIEQNKMPEVSQNDLRAG